MPKTPALTEPGTRRSYLVARDSLSKLGDRAREAQLAVLMALDMSDVIHARGDATCSEDDLARKGWARDDIKALGETAGAHLLAGRHADELRALHSEAA